MRILFALVLTHCFGLIIPANSHHDFKHEISTYYHGDIEDRPENQNINREDSSPGEILIENHTNTPVDPLRFHLRHIFNTREEKPSNKYSHSCHKSVDDGYEKASKDKNHKRVARDYKDSDDDDYRASDDRDKPDWDTGIWDDWTEWSECSTSCGCGRQVRWRHCSDAKCVKGLKKAQIRTCHLRDCNNKNLLSWLGVKA